MSRCVTVWQAWNVDDPESQVFLPTRKDVLKELAAIFHGSRVANGIRSRLPTELGCTVTFEGEGVTIHVRRIEVELSAQGVCRAMNTYP